MNIVFSTFSENLALQIDNFDVIVHPFISNRKNLVQKEFFKFQFFLYGSKNYIAQYGMPKKTSDLKNHRIIKYDSDGITPFHGVNDYMEDQKFYNFFDRRIIVVNNPITELNLVKNGIGLAMIASQWHNVLDIDLIKVLPNQFMFEEMVCLIYKHSEKDKILIDSLYEILLNETDKIKR